jgi:hypothetical protein
MWSQLQLSRLFNTRQSVNFQHLSQVLVLGNRVRLGLFPTKSFLTPFVLDVGYLWTIHDHDTLAYRASEFVGLMFVYFSPFPTA